MASFKKLLGFAALTALIASQSLAQVVTNKDGNPEFYGNKVGIGTTAPIAGASLDVGKKTDSILLPSGTTGQRPTGVNGMVRYNSTTPALEGYVNGNWQQLIAATNGVTAVASGGTGAQGFSQIARKIAMNLPQVMTVIPAGDSITQQANTQVSGVWQYKGLYEPALFSTGRFQEIRNAGVSGNTSTQLLARFQTDVIAYKPNVVIIAIGTNDYNASMTNANYQTLMNNIEQMIILSLDNSILPVLSVPPPNNTNYVAAKRARWFYYQLAQYYGLPVLDMYPVMVDPTTNGQFLSGYSGDGTHPNTAAIAALIPIFANVLQNINSPQQYPYLGAVAEQATGELSNLIENGSFDFGPMTSWGPNTSNGNYTNPAAAFPYSGTTFTYNLTTATGSYALYGNSVNTGSGFSVGDTLYAAARIKSIGLTPASANGFSFQLQCVGTSAILQYKSVYNNDVIFNTTFVVPTGTTSVVPDLFVSDLGTYIVNNITLVDVSAYSAIWQPGQQGIQ